MGIRYALSLLVASLVAMPAAAQAAEWFYFAQYVSYSWQSQPYYYRFYCSSSWTTKQAYFNNATGRILVGADSGHQYAMGEGAVELTMRPKAAINGIAVSPALLPAGSWYRVLWTFDEGFGESCLPCSNSYATVDMNEYNAVRYGYSLNNVATLAAATEVNIRVEICVSGGQVSIGAMGDSSARWRVYTPGSTDAYGHSGGTSSHTWPDGTGSITVTTGSTGIYLAQVASGDPPLEIYPSKKIPRYWELTTNLESVDATLVFAYEPSEIPEGVLETDLVVVTYDSEHERWKALDTLIDDTDHTASVSGLTDFSIFILADKMDPVPTEATSWGRLKSKYAD
jgi:hypothetical protein